MKGRLPLFDAGRDVQPLRAVQTADHGVTASKAELELIFQVHRHPRPREGRDARHGVLGEPGLEASYGVAALEAEATRELYLRATQCVRMRGCALRGCSARSARLHMLGYW